MKLNAGALYYVVFVVFVIFLLTGLFILENHYNNYLFDKEYTELQLEANVQSGFALLEKSPSQLPYDAEIQVDLYEDEQHTVSIMRKRWGVYETAAIRSKKGFSSYTKTALMGENIFVDEPVALYLADHQRYISLSGNTRIRGNAYLPKLGIRRAYIEGLSYAGDSLVYGEIQVSENKLPVLRVEWAEEVEKYLRAPLDQKTDSIISWQEIAYADSLFHSFSEKTLLIYSPAPVQTGVKNLKGNIRICSDSLVIVSKDTRLEEVIIYAPYIQIEKGFTGSGQFFAKKRMDISEGATLTYPSAVGVIGPSTKERPVELLISEGCRVEGVVFLYNTTYSDKERPLFKMEKKSLVEGQVYCNGKLELWGDVHGSVYTDQFYLKTPSAYYENHLLNAVIDFRELSRNYTGCNLVAGPIEKRIITWLE